VTLFELESLNSTSSGSTGGTVKNQNALISSATVYTRGSGLVFTTGSTFNSADFEEGTDKATAIAANNFITWSFTSTGVDLTDFSIAYDRSSSGPTAGVIQLSVNGGAFVDVLVDNSISDPVETNLNVDLSSFDNVLSGTFRFVGWNASSTAGTFDFENNSAINPTTASSFKLTGVEAVPEPATMAVLAAIGLAAARKRKA
jgi:hypothetical protein